MNKTKILASLFLILCLLLPSAVLADDGTSTPAFVADTGTTTDVTLVGQADLPQAQSPDTDTISPQTADNTQQGGSGQILANTFNPADAQSGTSTTQTIPLLQQDQSATSTPATATPQSVIPESDATVTPPLADQTQQPIAQLDSQPVLNTVAAMPVQKNDDSLFNFQISGGPVAVEKLPNKPSSQSTITSQPNLSPSAQNGLDISGTCADKYYVILLYLNAGDYEQSPASYIYNKAFDCVSGQYSYSLKDLPDTIKDGNYFLLVGSQGDKGSWVPQTSLTPITINRK